MNTIQSKSVKLTNYNGQITKNTKQMFYNSDTGKGFVNDNGEVYKLKDYDGYMRLLQGELYGKLLTINAELKITSETQAKKSDKFVHNNAEKYNMNEIIQADYKDKNSSYIEKIYISYDDESILIDLDNLSIIDNNSQFEIDYPENIDNWKKKYEAINLYKNLSKSYLTVNISGLEIILSYSPNPQIRGNINIVSTHLLSNLSGAIVHKLFTKDIKLKKINNIKPIVRKTDRSKPKNKIKEIFSVNKTGDNEIIEFEIY